MTSKADDMTKNKYGEEPDIIATAVPTSTNEAPIPANHARFYCSKCHTVRTVLLCVRLESKQQQQQQQQQQTLTLLLSIFFCCLQPYDLPGGATSWRCANCMTFNSTTQGECEWCTVL
jgi:LSD1 subclass zinc finger protein